MHYYRKGMDFYHKVCQVTEIFERFLLFYHSVARKLDVKRTELCFLPICFDNLSVKQSTFGFVFLTDVFCICISANFFCVFCTVFESNTFNNTFFQLNGK